jgi:hypothetical protein
MSTDPYPIQALRVISLVTLFLIACVLALLVIAVTPQVRIWREKFQIWRRDRRCLR